MKSLTINELINALSNIGKGEFHHLRFYSEPKTVDGTTIYKIADTTIRTKIDHRNMKDYVEPSYHRDEDSTYILSDALKLNNRTGNYLFKVAPLWSSYKVTYTEVDGTPIEDAVAKSRIKPSNRNNNTEPPIIITVNASKVLSLV